MLTNAHKELIRLLACLAAKDYLEAQDSEDAGATTSPKEGTDPPSSAEQNRLSFGSEMTFLVNDPPVAGTRIHRYLQVRLL